MDSVSSLGELLMSEEFIEDGVAYSKLVGMVRLLFASLIYNHDYDLLLV